MASEPHREVAAGESHRERVPEAASECDQSSPQVCVKDKLRCVCLLLSIRNRMVPRLNVPAYLQEFFVEEGL